MQGTSAELLAEEWHLSREALDAYSLESHRRAIAASDDGRFEHEIVPIELPDGASGGGVARRRSRSTRRRGARRRLEALASLKPAFRPGRRRDGRATRRRSSTAPPRCCRERARAPSASVSSRARGSSRSGSPASTRRGCCTATRRRCEKALARAGLTLDDMSVIEINEAFASVVLQTVADLHLERAHGRRQSERRRHLARSSARRDRRAHHGDAVSELERRDARYGIASMCIGFGMAIAGVVERL